MHETMVAQSLCEAICAEAAKHNAKPISAKISCGMLNALNEDILSFAFEAIAKGSICEGLRLVVEHKPILARCKRCAKDFEFDITTGVCTNCQSSEFELLPDAPLLLEEIEFDTE